MHIHNRYIYIYIYIQLTRSVHYSRGSLQVHFELGDAYASFSAGTQAAILSNILFRISHIIKRDITSDIQVTRYYLRQCEAMDAGPQSLE